MSDISLLRTALGILVLLAGIMAMHSWGKINLGYQPVVAALRAVLQLSAIAIILAGVFTQPWTAAFMIIVMLVIATWTAGRRLSKLRYGMKAAIVGVASAGIITSTLIFTLGLVNFEVRYIIAICGIIIGNSMSGVTLAGRNFMRATDARRGEVEGWLALGATSVTAYGEIARESVRESLIPNIDQTKSTGLVTLPGAFVGALFGGASPVEAARFQLVVLVGIMFAMTLGGLVATRILSSSPTLQVSDDQPLPVAQEKSGSQDDPTRDESTEDETDTQDGHKPGPRTTS